jgi:hypothetical protein
VKSRTYETAERLRRKYVSDPARDLLDDLRAGLDVADSHAERQALTDAAMDAADALAAGDNDAYAEMHARIDAVANPPVDPGIWDKARGQFVDAELLASENPSLGRVLAAVKGAANAGEVDEIVAAALSADVEWSDAEVAALWGVTDSQVDDGTATSAAERDERDAAKLFAEAVADREAAEAAEQAPTLLADAMAEGVTS